MHDLLVFLLLAGMGLGLIIGIAMYIYLEIRRQRKELEQMTEMFKLIKEMPSGPEKLEAFKLYVTTWEDKLC